MGQLLFSTCDPGAIIGAIGAKAHDGQPRRSNAKRNDHIEQGAGAVDPPQHKRNDAERKGDDPN